MAVQWKEKSRYHRLHISGEAPYQPIEDYGLIGNMRTAALVGKNGAIDWFCFPRFDSPSLFGALLDAGNGGHFRIYPAQEETVTRQFYWPDTNILITRFLTPEGVGEITDFMPLIEKEGQPQQIVRTVKAARGQMKFRLECLPAFNYGRDKHHHYIGETGACFSTEHLKIGLSTDIPLKEFRNVGVCAEFTLDEEESATFVLGEIRGEECAPAPSPEKAEKMFRHSVNFWRNWIAKCTYTGRWREMVRRSALILKLLSYEPTGAIIAAPTCSLPESLGGPRNWDYRYTWIRDAAFTLYAFMHIGLTDEAERFMAWLTERCFETRDGRPLNILYGIEGEDINQEIELDHWEGYMGSSPVRIGNAANRQTQLDIYGELMDAAFLYNKYGAPIPSDLWDKLRKIADWVCTHWQEPDHGIWEFRTEKRHFVYSKLMCWVCLDRALRIADSRGFPASREYWTANRDAIYEELMEKGWNEEVGSFVQHYDCDALDASTLIMPLTLFLSPIDSKLERMLQAICRPPSKGGLVSNSLVYRYDPSVSKDGFEREEGTFNLCSFWLVDAMTRAGRHNPQRLEDARLMFEKMLGYANHLGLFAEETGPCGGALGNYPQAFTHLALITSAYNLDLALDQRFRETEEK